MLFNSSKKTTTIVTQTNQSSIRTANHRLFYFFRYGNKENIEVHLRKLRIKRAKKIHSNQGVSNVSVVHQAQQIKANRLFNSFFHTVVPFIILKTKKSRKKVDNSKIFPLTPWLSECQSIKDLSAFIKKTKSTSQPFMNRLEHIIETLMITSRKGTVSSANTASNITLREKRDIVHRKAFQIMPSIWKKM